MSTNSYHQTHHNYSTPSSYEENLPLHDYDTSYNHDNSRKPSTPEVIQGEFEVEDASPGIQRPSISNTPRQLSSPSTFDSVKDVALATAPIFFLFLCIAAIILDNKPTKNNTFGSRIEEATKLGPTIFPILFAAIVGRTLKIIACFYAEKGAKLGTLELLIASQSIWSTLEGQFNLRRLTNVGACILILWTLSPIGGQASLRLLKKQYQTQTEPFKLRYLVTGPAAPIWPQGEFGTEGNVYANTIEAISGASFLSTDETKAGPRDVWGNVKIPRLESLDHSSRDSSGWINIPDNTTVENFSSLVGLPVVGTPSDANSSFNLESSYLTLECDAPQKVALPQAASTWKSIVGELWGAIMNSTESNPLNYETGNDTDVAGNSISLTYFLDTYLGVDDPARLDGYFGIANASANTDQTFNETRKIVFGSVVTDQNHLAMVNCSINEVHVETLVNCTTSQCGVSKMRTSIQDTRPSQLTSFEVLQILQAFFFEVPSFGGGDQGLTSSSTEIFINNTSLTPYNSEVYNAGLVDLSLVSKEDISTRLSIVFNTYFQIMTFPGSFVGDHQQNLSMYGPDTTPIDAIKTWFGTGATLDDILADLQDGTDDYTPEIKNAPFAAATSYGTASRNYEVYTCNFVWLAFLFISTITLLATGIAGIFIRRRILVPDILGRVASMTYGNPFIKLPEGGSTLDANDRARALQDLKLQVGDVQGDEEVGHIVLTAGIKTRKLERSRLYI